MKSILKSIVMAIGGAGDDYSFVLSRALIHSKKWKVHSADAFALFPGTDHVECVVVFDRID